MSKVYILFSLLISTLSFSQNTTQVVTSNAGDYSQSSEASLSWTLGELVIESASTDMLILTQGFQQGNLNVIPSQLENQNKYELTVHPNPTPDFLIVKSEKNNIAYKLFDSNGQLVLEGETSDFEDTLNLSQLPTGTYILKFEEHTLYKIIKQ